MLDNLPREDGTYEILEEQGEYTLYMNLKGFPYEVTAGTLDHLSKLIEGTGFVSQVVKERADRAKAKVHETTRTLFGFTFGTKKKIEKKVQVVPGEEKVKSLFKK